MFNLVLFEPEIPPNTGNVIRLAANTGCSLHLIEPLGFELDDKRLRRAGLDYREFAELQIHASWADFLDKEQPQRIMGLTTKGQQCYSDMRFDAGDYLVFGPETRGLPSAVLDTLPPSHRLRLPMLADSRSLNLSNTVAIVTYEALRQYDFNGLA